MINTQNWNLLQKHLSGHFGKLSIPNCPFIWCPRALGSRHVPPCTQAGRGVCAFLRLWGRSVWGSVCAELEDLEIDLSELSDPPITWKTPGAPWGRCSQQKTMDFQEPPRAGSCSPPPSPVLAPSLIYERSVLGLCLPSPASVWHHPATPQLSSGCLSPRCLPN